MSDPEACFFQNITHMQVHRRARALLRLRTFLENSAEESGGAGRGLRVASLVHVLVPLVRHVVFESGKAQEHNLREEAVATVCIRDS